MRSIKSGLIVFAVAGAFGVLAVVGCSASGSSGVTDDQSPTEPAGDDDSNTLQPSQGTSSGDPTPAKDAGKDSGKDSGKSDAAKDAGPPPPNEGDPCTKLNEIKSKSCGKCGTAETACIDDGAGGGPKWTTYGACHDESGECVPGTSSTETCGNCGTLTKTCNQYCAYTTTACAGEPVNSCVAGSSVFQSAGCPAGLYRTQVCSAACTQGNLSATCSIPESSNKLSIGANGSTVSGQYVLSSAQIGKKVYTCGSSLTSTADYPYVAVELSNPNATQATVTLYTQALTPGGDPELDVVMWAYAGTALPMDDTALKACNTTWGVQDSCGSANLCQNVGSTYDWAGITGATIPANGKILVYVASYSPSETGNFKLFANVTKLN